MSVLWEYYTLNVDILVKILYKPSVDLLVRNASRDAERIDAPTEALLFAIWLASVKTMSAEECTRLHREDRSVLIPRYRHGLEQALEQANWMTTQEIVVLQALILHLVS